VTTAVARDAALTAADRCDRCGAPAYVRAELPGGGELLFCAHHGRKHADASGHGCRSTRHTFPAACGPPPAPRGRAGVGRCRRRPRQPPSSWWVRSPVSLDARRPRAVLGQHPEATRTGRRLRGSAPNACPQGRVPDMYGQIDETLCPIRTIAAIRLSRLVTIWQPTRLLSHAETTGSGSIRPDGMLRST